jgi:hypothetical protein
MLSRPEHGWSTVTIGRHKLDVSYIEPAAEMLVMTLIQALTCKEASVTFDAEGWHWRLDFSGDETRLTLMSSVTKTHVIPMTAREMAREVLGDLRRDMDAWSSFCSWSAADQEAELTRLCNQLERLL